MISKESILECIKAPMEQYHRKIVHHFSNWKPLVEAAEKILAGEEVHYEQYPEVYHPNIKMMKLIMKYTSESTWDWSNPEIQKAYQEVAASEAYRIYAEAMAGIICSIIKKIPIGTLVELGTGPGELTKSLCGEMLNSNLSIPVIVSDRTPAIAATAENLRQTFPSLTFHDFVWDVRQKPPAALIDKLAKPVLLFERWCIPYGGYETIHNIAPVADVLLLVEDLSLSGTQLASDIIFGKIGLQFYTFSEARNLLARYYSFIHMCDSKTIETINAPNTNFILAVKK
jgi:hypothetical protein